MHFNPTVLLPVNKLLIHVNLTLCGHKHLWEFLTPHCWNLFTNHLLGMWRDSTGDHHIGLAVTRYNCHREFIKSWENTQQQHKPPNNTLNKKTWTHGETRMANSALRYVIFEINWFWFGWSENEKWLRSSHRSITSECSFLLLDPEASRQWKRKRQKPLISVIRRQLCLALPSMADTVEDVWSQVSVVQLEGDALKMCFLGPLEKLWRE